jgi:hypothetical protein
MSSPNLFEFATSELSQDAFICWFLSWAKEENKEQDEKIHKCARNFIEQVFKKHDKQIPEIKNIEVKKQHKKIDVLCIVNNTYAIIIEDKIHTSQHSNQLVRYKEIIQEKIREENILGIYYKTENQSNFEEVTNKGYKTFWDL